MNTRIRPLDYDGISHARLTRRMTQARIPATAKELLAEIFRAIPVGQWRHISHATFARRLGRSEGTISRNMAILTGEARYDDGTLINPTPFIARRKIDGGFGGYEIAPLPPPELRRRLAPPPPADPASLPQGAISEDRLTDPLDSIPLQAIATPQTEAERGSVSRSPHPLLHASSGSSMAGEFQNNPVSNKTEPTPELTRQSNTPTQIPPAETLELLGLLEHQGRALMSVAPKGYGTVELVRDMQKLRTRPDVRSPFAVLKRSLAAGEPIYSQKEIDDHLASLTVRVAPKEKEEIPDALNQPPRRDAAPGRPARSGRARTTPTSVCEPECKSDPIDWHALPSGTDYLAGLGMSLSGEGNHVGGFDGGPADEDDCPRSLRE